MSELNRYANIVWPSSMWPLEPSFLEALPRSLLPKDDELVNIKYPWEILGLVLDILDRRLDDPGVRIGENVKIKHPNQVVIEGNVWIDDGVTIYGAARLVGPTYIGRQVLVGDYALIRHSVIGDDSQAGARAEIIRSVLGHEVQVHRAYAGDSVLSQGVHLAGGAQTANERLDRGHIKSLVDGQVVNTGLNKFGGIIGRGSVLAASSTTMPGIKIGSGCVVGPGVIVTRDLPDNTQAFVNQSLSFTTVK